MLALYRCGRQAEALSAYQRTRRMLVDELGVEPGRELRDLQAGILAGDPALAAPGPTLAGFRWPGISRNRPGPSQPARPVRPVRAAARRPAGEAASRAAPRQAACGAAGTGRLARAGPPRPGRPAALAPVPPPPARA